MLKLLFHTILLSIGLIGCGEASLLKGDFVEKNSEPSANLKINPAYQIFSQTVHPVLQENCISCHGQNSPRPFASLQQFQAYEFIQKQNLIDLENLKDSKFLKRLLVDRHNCSTRCDALANQITEYLALMKAANEWSKNQIVGDSTEPFDVINQQYPNEVKSVLPGDFVYIEAAKSLEGSSFQGWSGNVEFYNAQSAKTFFIMPKLNVNLQPNYQENTDPNTLTPWVQLTVNNGHGSGSYDRRQNISIESVETHSAYSFSHWSGDTEYLDDEQNNPAFVDFSNALELNFTANYLPTNGRQFFKGSAFLVPGIIQMEDFDAGPAGLSYLDSDTVNNLGAYRNEAVDIVPLAQNNQFKVGYVRPGEWLDYSLMVQQSGSHQFFINLSQTQAGGQFRVKIDDVDVTGLVDIPNTGNWDTFRKLEGPRIYLNKGPRLMRIEFVRASAEGYVADFDSFEFLKN